MPRVQRGKVAAISMCCISAEFVLFCRTKENEKSASNFDALDPRIKGCSPLIIPQEKSKRKNASRFAKTGCGAQRPLRALSGTRVLLTAAPTAPPCIRRWRRSSPLHFFLASPIDRPLSRCGGRSPQGSGRARSVTFGDTLSPFCRCATSSPDRGKSFKGRGKKHSLHSLGSPFGRAGAKRLRGFVPQLTRCSPQGSECQQMPSAVTTLPVKKQTSQPRRAGLFAI